MDIKTATFAKIINFQNIFVTMQHVLNLSK